MEISDIVIESEKKSYVLTKLSDHREIFLGSFKYEGNEYQVSPEIVSEISRLSGVPSKLSRILMKQNVEAWIESVLSMCEYYYSDAIALMLEAPDNAPSYVSHISFKTILPLLNAEFLQTMASMLPEYADIAEVDSFNYEKSSYISDMIIFPVKDYTYQGKTYRLGAIFQNDELDTVTCRLVVDTNGFRFYLPTKYYNLSASRYLRTSSDRKEALSQLLLKVLEDMNADSWYSIIPEVSMNLSHCDKISVTYEEYRQAVRLLSNIVIDSDIEEEEAKDLRVAFEEKFTDFEKNYPLLDEKKGIYVWRCSALSENTITALLQYLHGWTVSGLFYPTSVHRVREFLGEFIMLSRISTNLAKRK